MSLIRYLSAILAVAFLTASAYGGMGLCLGLSFESEALMSSGHSLVESVLKDTEGTRVEFGAIYDRGEQASPARWSSLRENLANAYRSLGSQARALLKLKQLAASGGRPDLEARLSSVIGEISDLQVETDLAIESVTAASRLSAPRAISATGLAKIEAFLAARKDARAFSQIRCSGQISVNGHDYDVFEILASGGEGTAFSALRDGEVVVVKEYRREDAAFRVERQVVLAKFLASKGFRTVDVIEGSPEEGRLVTHFVEGHTREELDSLYSRGQISREDHARAMAKLAACLSKLATVERSSEFKNLEIQRRASFPLDTNSRNFIYRNGEWVLIDF